MKHQRIDCTKRHKLIRAQDAKKHLKDAENKTNKTKNEQIHEGEFENRNGGTHKDAVLVAQGEVGLPSDEKVSIINAIEVAADDMLLMSDGANHKLKLFDAGFTAISEIVLSSEPYNLVMFNPRTAIVNLYKEFTLQEVIIENKVLTLGKRTDLSVDLCRLVKYRDKIITFGADKLYFSLLVMNSHGQILKRIISYPLDENLPFRHIVYMTLNFSEDILYITDWRTKSCRGLSMNGDIIFEYSEVAETKLAGMCTDSDGFLYIGCMDTGKIVMVGDGGDKVKDLVVFQQGMRPGYIVYKETLNKLFVKVDGSNKILVYRLVSSA